MASTVTSAISRKVVAFPPVIVRNPSTPSRRAWSRSVWERLTSRVSEASCFVSSNRGRAPPTRTRARACRNPRDELLALVEHVVDLPSRDLELVPGRGRASRSSIC